jgi:hypothetical protein
MLGLLAFHIATNLVDHPSFGRGHKHIVGKTKDRPYIFDSTHRNPLSQGRKNKKEEEKRGMPAPALTPSTQKPFTPSLEFRSLEWKDE